MRLPIPLRRGIRLRALLWLLLALASALPRGLLAVPMELGAKKSYSLNNAMEVLEDPDGTMGIVEVEEAYARGAFRRLEGELSAGFSRSAFWLRFELRRTQAFPETCWLRLWPVYTEHMELYLPASGNRPIRMGSADIPHNDVLWLPEPAAPIRLKGEDPVVGYLRMQGGNSIALDASLHTYGSLQAYSQTFLSRIAAYIGVTLFAMLIALIVHRITGARPFRLFALYAFTVLLLVVPLNGMNSILFPDWTRPLMAVILRALTGAGILAFLRFTLSLFEPAGKRWLERYFNTLSLLAVATMLASPTPWYGMVVSATMVACSSLVPVLSLLSLKIEMPSRGVHLVFMAAMLSTITGHILFFLHLMGVVGHFTLIHDIVQASSMVHFLLLIPALVLRIRSTQQRKQELAEQALARSEVLAERLGRELREHSSRLELSIAAGRSSADRMEKFLAMVAHDYRSPLTIINGNLELMARVAPECARLHGGELRKIRQATKRLEEMVEVSLAQGRIADTDSAGNDTCFALQDLLHRQLDAARLLWPDRQFVESCTAGEELVWGDLSLLDTALYNLLDNAEKYSPKDSPVTMGCMVHDREAAITVTNTMAAGLDDDLEPLFEQFRRGPNTSGTAGAGLGLSIVQSIAERHGGVVELRKKEHNGFAVTLLLPIVDEGPESGTYAEP